MFALSGHSKRELQQICTGQLGWENYRTAQVCSWLYAKSSSNFAEWSDLGTERIKQLQSLYKIPLLEVKVHNKSKRDRTEKFLLSLPDGLTVESVLMRFRDRDSTTACISSQVGCAVGCTFCATGKLGFKRNLSAAEIVDQVMCIQRKTGQKVHNLVFMGQGEPLFNLGAVLDAISIFRESVGIGARRMTVSTSGAVPQIIELGRSGYQINLAVSLHSAIQTQREQLVPIAKRWNLFELMDSIQQHFNLTGRRITFEYVLLSGVNDTPEHARALADLLHGLNFPCLVNLIPYNDTGGQYSRPLPSEVERFKQIAERSGRKFTVRVTLGDDIDAACGQLANKITASTNMAA